jgi:type I restriction-modification system DNA methylase subunit
MAKSTKSENLTNEHLRKEFENKGLADLLEFQKTEDKVLQSKLKSKTEKRTDGRGRPEFIIKLRGIASDVLLAECKNDKLKHNSPFLKEHWKTSSIITKADWDKLKPADYAEDGVIHYMLSCIDDYNCVGLAYSGTNSASNELTTLISENGVVKKTTVSHVMDAKSYINLLKNKSYQINDKLLNDQILKELPILNDELRKDMKLEEQSRPNLIAACLLALQFEPFRNSYKNYSKAEALVKAMESNIEIILVDKGIQPAEKVEIIKKQFHLILNNDNVKNNLRPLLDKLDYLFNGFSFDTTTVDVLGSFYSEFLKYTGGDKQGLGIVLTPQHITEIFCDLGELTKDSVVMDICAGTGGFLVSAMTNMIAKANGDEQKIQNIKKNQIIGVEQQEGMYTLMSANMILRNDGKANIFNGSSLSPEIHEKIKALNPTVVLLNPPYSQKKPGETELDFIQLALDLLASKDSSGQVHKTGGKLVAIVPMSCVTDFKDKSKIQKRHDLLKNHTLDAVLSMPNELFYGVGTNTCVMVFTAGKPHLVERDVPVYDNEGSVISQSKKMVPHKKTFFGYFKDDGFVRTKNGRKDKQGKWAGIRAKWLDLYQNGKTSNISLTKDVTGDDEWCAEAYMTVDFTKITQKEFEDTFKRHLAYVIINPIQQDNSKKNKLGV